LIFDYKLKVEWNERKTFLADDDDDEEILMEEDRHEERSIVKGNGYFRTNNR
jgi:hypothetical protein